MNNHLRHIAARYQRFAVIEARGNSPLYEQLANAVAESEAVLEFIAGLPPDKQQPNLLFGAVKYLFGTPKGPDQFVRLVINQHDLIRGVVLSKSTQTNEPARCATLLPVLAGLPQPLALLEVGAAAGLCLLPDYYRYEYGSCVLEPRFTISGREPPTFTCDVDSNVPVPAHMPEIVWRAGLDLNPINLSDAEECHWLESLVWPGQESRAVRLKQAIDFARDVPIPLKKADLLSGLSRLVESAPKAATVVVFHSAVLSYVNPEITLKFSDMIRKLDVIWLSNEGVNVLPWLTGVPESAASGRSFVLSVNEKPIALTGPHGQHIQWLDECPVSRV